MVSPRGGGGALAFSRSQLLQAFGHAADFGITSGTGNMALFEFGTALQAHLDGPLTRSIQGSYRGAAVTHFLDPDTGLNVMRDAQGNFLSAWRLSPQQLQQVLSTGSLADGP